MRFIAVLSVAVLVLSMASTVFAAPVARYGYGCGGGYSLMRDAYGNFLDKDAFEENLDKWIEDGYILSENREYYVDMYDFCASNGGGYMGGCGGRGRGMMRGW